MTATLLLRLRRLLVEHGPAVALALLLVGAGALAGGWWLHANPRTAEVTEFTHSQSVRTGLSTSATATGETFLYREGERLHDERVYLQRSAPTVSVALRTSVPPDRAVRVEQRLVLVTLAEHETGVFWRNNRTLAHTRTTTESGRVVSRARLNVTALRETLARRQAALGEAGSLRVRLRYVVRYDTGRYTGTVANSVPIDIGNGWYRIPTPTTTRTRRTSVTRTVAVPRNRLTYLGPAAAGGAAVLAGVVLAVVWWWRLRHADVAALTRRIQRRAHSEWISTGTVEDVDGDRRVAVDSIEDLVDVAIDTDRRVIHDPDRGCYAVFDGDTVYTFAVDSGEWEWQESLGHQP